VLSYGLECSEGAWIGSVEAETGNWLIGDQFPTSHPGYVPQEDPRGLMVKYWLADKNEASHKYQGDVNGGGHEVIPPPVVHGGRYEGVQVFVGEFFCEHPQKMHYVLAHRGGESRLGDNCLELAPTAYRRWYLNGSPSAAGVTICRYRESLLDSFGAGTGYEYRLLDNASLRAAEWQYRTRRSREVAAARYLLIMVFRGALIGKKDGQVLHHLSAYARNYAYVEASSHEIWMPVAESVRTVAAVVFY